LLNTFNRVLEERQKLVDADQVAKLIRRSFEANKQGKALFMSPSQHSVGNPKRSSAMSFNHSQKSQK
jgi:hypothetical protein